MDNGNKIKLWHKKVSHLTDKLTKAVWTIYNDLN